MSFKIEFTNEEILSQIKSNYSDNINQSLEDIITYLRHLQKKDSSGIYELQVMLNKEWIKPEQYEKIQYLILHPDELYEITVNEDSNRSDNNNNTDKPGGEVSATDQGNNDRQ